MSDTRKRASLEGVMPFFIVSRLQAALEFYVEHLGFAIEVCIPEEAPYFAIVCRDRVGIMLKEIGKEIQPQPNHTRHGWARWDAYIYTPDPDALFEEWRGKNVTFHRPLEDTEDGLRAFEILDGDGYVLCLDERDKCNAKATFHILSVVAADWHRCGALLPGLSQHNSHPGVLWIQSGIYANYGLLFNMSCVLTGVYGLAKLCE